MLKRKTFKARSGCFKINFIVNLVLLSFMVFFYLIIKAITLLITKPAYWAEDNPHAEQEPTKTGSYYS